MKKHLLAVCMTSLMAVGAASAQDSLVSPYTAIQGREIKALSAEDILGLMNGDGMSLALAAELNGYAGPRHVLELADSLDLTSEQREQTRLIFAAMQEAARDLGNRVVQVERELDSAFANQTINQERLVSLTATIGSLQGQLRARHLEAHLQTNMVLSDHQLMLYQQLRGYGEGGHEHGHVPR